MNDGTQAAREAANLVDLDSDPTKLIEIVRVGKQLLISRGSLTTFSIANDVAKYFAILPALFVATYPQLGALNADSPGVARGAVCAGQCGSPVASQSFDLRPWRTDRSFCRHQIDRHGHYLSWSCVTEKS